jgi:peptide-methionine (S)-S-oxide reductase
VVRTRVGYSGGRKQNPTYHDLGDQTETIQVDYDPSRVTYAQLLQVFWRAHHPGAASWSRQYQAAVFYHTEEQKRLAEQTRDEIAAKLGGPVQTKILPATEFYLAEDYHQKYYLRRDPELLREFQGAYGDAGLVASTAAARVNGYAAGYGALADLDRELFSLGLSPGAAQKLRRAVAASSGPSSLCPVN